MKKVITITAIALFSIAPAAQAGWFFSNPEECLQSKVVEDAVGNKVGEDAIGEKSLSCGFSLNDWF